MVKIALIPLKINEVNSSEELLLVGYPGSRIPRNRALPYSRIDPGTLFDTNGNQMKQSKGSIINLNNEFNSNYKLFSRWYAGSPILQKRESDTVVVSMLLGGPAVEFHSDFINIGILVSQQSFTHQL